MRGPVSVAFAALLTFVTVALASAPASADEAPPPAPAPAPELAPAPAPPPAPAPTIAPSTEVGAPPAPAPVEPAFPAPLPETPPDAAENPTLHKLVATRRAGIVIGVAPGIAFAGASGYPNNAVLIGNPSFYSESPMLVGTSTTYFLMGALTDYFSFGPMVNIARFESARWKSTGVGIGFRGEVFPLVRLFPTLADTAIYGQAGVGSTELQAKGDYPSADGTQSFAGIGLHHELRFFRLLGGHFSGGPYAEYDAIFATSAERHWASVGLRVAWYGGAVTADQH